VDESVDAKVKLYHDGDGVAVKNLILSDGSVDLLIGI
jgi:hypothetical protein